MMYSLILVLVGLRFYFLKSWFVYLFDFFGLFSILVMDGVVCGLICCNVIYVFFVFIDEFSSFVMFVFFIFCCYWLSNLSFKVFCLFLVCNVLVMMLVVELFFYVFSVLRVVFWL